MKKISRFISLAVIISLISVPGNFAFAEDLHGQEKEKDKKQIVENSDSSLNQNKKPQNETLLQILFRLIKIEIFR